MNLFTFSEQFKDEASCRKHFKEQRDQAGVICKKCGGKAHYWLPHKESYECKGCKFRTTLRSGTIMESSKLSFLVWYKTISLMSATKKSFSAKEIQRQLGLKRYEPVWAMVHKIRLAMGKRDAQYNLSDMVEMDEGYFTVESSAQRKKERKRGRGSQAKATVSVLAESTPLEDPQTGKVSRHCRYFKAKVLQDGGSEGIEEALKESIDERTIVFSDKSTSYVNIADYVELHIQEKSSRETTVETLKWVHIAISNAKRNFLGVYHKIKGKYLQRYLDEFIYKLNRRYFGGRLFDRLVVACVFASR